MIINIEKIKQEKQNQYFKATIYSRSRTRKHYMHQKDVIREIVKKYDLKKYELIPENSSGALNKDQPSGIYVLKVEDKPVDILKNNVKIDTTKIEAEVPQVEEQKNEASLPNGLKKITKTKRKRATKKKTTEE